MIINNNMGKVHFETKCSALMKKILLLTWRKVSFWLWRNSSHWTQYCSCLGGRTVLSRQDFGLARHILHWLLLSANKNNTHRKHRKIIHIVSTEVKFTSERTIFMQKTFFHIVFIVNIYHSLNMHKLTLIPRNTWIKVLPVPFTATRTWPNTLGSCNINIVNRKYL